MNREEIFKKELSYIKTDKVIDVSKEYNIPKLRHAVVREMVLDGYDNMWISTNMGLCRLNLKTATHQFYNTAPKNTNAIPNDDVFDLLLADSLIYITTGNGLSTYHYDTDSFVPQGGRC